MVTLIGSFLALFVFIFRLDLNLLECSALVVVVLLARFGPSLGIEWFRRIERFFGRVARKRGLAVAAIFVATVWIRVALLPIVPVPQPRIVDEFSHLLLADTLSHGRLTNPTHPLWKHFETIHVIQRPTYNSMYFPAQGMILAFGKILGDPWFGVLLSCGAMSAAVLWMLQGWFPPGWALLGGAICMVRYGVFSYWANSYWGGAAGVIGGALVLGVVARMDRRIYLRHAVLLAVGLLILMNSRPFEGAALAIPAGAGLLDKLRRLPLATLRKAGAGALLVFLLVMAAGACLMMGYFRAVTGNPLTAPYRVNQQTYGWPLTLAWFTVAPAKHTWQPMHDYYLWEAQQHEKFQIRAHLMENSGDILMLWSFFVGPLLSAPLVLLPAVWRDRKCRLLIVTAACMIAALSLEQTRYPHYAGPATCVAVGLVVASMRHVRAAGRRTGRGPALVRMIPVAALACSVALVAMPQRLRYPDPPNRYSSWCCTRTGNLERASILRYFNAIDDRHLLIVRYGPGHSWMNEWVFNEADIDHAKVVWARDAGDGNPALLRYFRDRKVWIIEPDYSPPRLTRAAADPD
jgi:hypothetical protein